MTDYQRLLIRYIQHVRNEQGMDFLGDWHLGFGERNGGHSCDLFFTAEEAAELKKLREEVTAHG